VELRGRWSKQEAFKIGRADLRSFLSAANATWTTNAH
jgi:hypothetical protein